MAQGAARWCCAWRWSGGRQYSSPRNQNRERRIAAGEVHHRRPRVEVATKNTPSFTNPTSAATSPSSSTNANPRHKIRVLLPFRSGIREEISDFARFALSGASLKTFSVTPCTFSRSLKHSIFCAISEQARHLPNRPATTSGTAEVAPEGMRRITEMTNRHTLKFSIFAAAILALALPAAASAQWGRYPDRDPR